MSKVKEVKNDTGTLDKYEKQFKSDGVKLLLILGNIGIAICIGGIIICVVNIW